MAVKNTGLTGFNDVEEKVAGEYFQADLEGNVAEGQLTFEAFS